MPLEPLGTFLVSLSLTSALLAQAPRDSEWDHVFERASGWTGADVAGSFETRDGRVVWVFGDTWIGQVEKGAHVVGSKLVNNTVAVHAKPREPGLAPPPDSVEFLHRQADDGAPLAWIAPEPPARTWYWASGGGVAFRAPDHSERLAVGLFHVARREAKEDAWGFEVIGSAMAIVDNASAPAREWRPRAVTLPRAPASAVQSGGAAAWLLAATPEETAKGEETVWIFGEVKASRYENGLLLARAPRPTIDDIASWRFFAGEGRWSERAEDARPVALGITSELSVEAWRREDGQARYVLVHSEPLLGKRIFVRTAARPEGPWSERREVFTVPDVERSKAYFTYAAKGHLHLSRPGELLITYLVNANDLGSAFRDASIYRPRFIRVPLRDVVAEAVQEPGDKARDRSHRADGSTPPLRAAALHALRSAVAYFRTEVAVEGTYLWRYSEDLTRREGEGKASSTQAWVQPPGTPSVGAALLRAYDATGDDYCLKTARETALGLVRGQLRSGGWHDSIDFDPQGLRPLAYRAGSSPGARDVTTLDDDTTQSAVRFLLAMDERLSFMDERVHGAVLYALEALLGAQRANGGWPQTFSRPADPARFPPLRASYPADWPREWPDDPGYHDHYTLNDNVLGDVVATLLDAVRILGAPERDERSRSLAARCQAAVAKAGEFLLAAQLPEPQPVWAQQYDAAMHPAWARKFEPPAVTGGESQGALQALLDIFEATGERRFLEPIARAIEHLRRSRLPDGKLARFYELQTNRPLYLTRSYELTYDDGDLPTHYSFKVADRTDAIERRLEALRARPPGAPPVASSRPPASAVQLEEGARQAIEAQDARGRWVEPGRLRYHGEDDTTRRVISTSTFIRNVETLARYLEATRER